MKFRLKREVDLGDLLTPISILISLVTVLLTWQNERESRMRQDADSIRRSSSTVSAKLERWGTLAGRYFDDIQPVLITASTETAKTHKNIPARTDLFRGLREAEGKSSQRIVDEQLETAYMELYGYVPSLRPPFDKIRQEITEKEQESHRRLEQVLQTKINNTKLLESSDSSDMGNELRTEVLAERKNLDKEIRDVTEPLRTNILKLINLSDKDLLDTKKRAAELAIFENKETKR